MTDRTPYQDAIIRRYYENLDQTAAQRGLDLVSDLYLATGKKRNSLWKRAAAVLTNLGIKQEVIDSVIESDSPERLLKVLQQNEEKPQVKK
ncbi:MAG: hypothetical protein LBU65_16740 [Planctomycetaceae bacterium]|jgi:hypothetical protein|nr:hypothetical protein [Planctomycetaceae bacterium]